MKKLPIFEMLTIIIITKNEEKMLSRLLESIKNQDFKNYEIIVSDAKSTDNTRVIAKKYKCKIINGGLPSVGRNNGAKVAKNDLLLFLDADVMLPPKFLTKNIEEFNEKHLISATTLYVPLSKKLIEKFFYYIYNSFARNIQFFSPHAGGFCIFMNKNVFFKIGMFDENIRFAEDHALVKLSKKHGKFRILTSVPVLVDTRRLKKDGMIETITKYVLAELHRIFKGEIKNPPFEYDMQGVNMKKKI
jgi:glycosyltransferase involved in cell wall biosynthesis